jgi:hypothetical protein
VLKNRSAVEIMVIELRSGMSETPCLIYEGTLQSKGYGFRRGRIAQELGTTLVHRQEWIKTNGPIPKGLLVLHRCDNPACYRLDHLFLGTQKDNMADCAAKGRATRPLERYTHCKHGHPFDEENTYWVKRGKYWFRNCRACNREAQRRFQRRRRGS